MVSEVRLLGPHYIHGVVCMYVGIDLMMPGEFDPIESLAAGSNNN